ncbi:hypothetical protein T03_2354 [Trichinella britovi]|uniref:Uncharacterized protein n=1 Tax=Trichinella britovi TaxID=45882 RepID=A0A0V1D411_TRIBR|nr:hypothetical protein T03_2354 [Trichinella britovi]
MQNILLPISYLSYSFTYLQECIAFGVSNIKCLIVKPEIYKKITVIALCQLLIYYLVQLPYTLVY